jgi:hypothetical protein
MDGNLAAEAAAYCSARPNPVIYAARFKRVYRDQDNAL